MPPPFHPHPNPSSHRPFASRPGYADALVDMILPAASLAAVLTGTPLCRLFQPPTPARLCVLLSSLSVCHGAAWLLDRRSPAGHAASAAAWRLARSAAEAALAASAPSTPTPTPSTSS